MKNPNKDTLLLLSKQLMDWLKLKYMLSPVMKNISNELSYTYELYSLVYLKTYHIIICFYNSTSPELKIILKEFQGPDETNFSLKTKTDLAKIKRNIVKTLGC